MISARSSYGFIFAGWLTIPAWSGYFCEASPPSGYYPHPHLLYMIKQFFRTAFSNSFHSLFLYVFQGKINSWFLSTPEMENSMVVHRAIGVQQPTCLWVETLPRGFRQLPAAGSSRYGCTTSTTNGTGQDQHAIPNQKLRFVPQLSRHKSQISYFSSFFSGTIICPSANAAG